jgi:hypothetical protein
MFYRGSPPPGYVHKDLELSSSLFIFIKVLALCITSEVHKCTSIGEADQCHTKLHSLQPNPQLQLKNRLISKTDSIIAPQLSKLVSATQKSSKTCRSISYLTHTTNIYTTKMGLNPYIKDQNPNPKWIRFVHIYNLLRTFGP